MVATVHRYPTGVELSRMASRGVVVGGFGKLLKHIIKDTGAATVFSYCDLRFGDGTGYEKLGFTPVGHTDPDWWWLPKNNTRRRVPRQASQDKRIHRTPHLEAVRSAYPHLRGDSVATKAGWRRIYGVGSLRYVLDTTSITA